MPRIPFAFPATLTATLILLSPQAVAAAITHEFDVGAGGSLRLEADGAEISVTGTDTDEAVIEITRGNDDADDIEEDYVIEFAQDGNTITGTVKRRSRSGDWGSRGLDIDIELPEVFDVDLRTSGGPIGIRSLAGVIDARTSGGGLHFENVDGPITGRTSGGSIFLDGTTGDAELRTSGGGITIGTVAGSVIARTSGGGISVDGAGGGIEAKTSGGSITATLSGQPGADSTLSTSGGSVEVSLSPDIAVSVDAKTSGGSIHSELPLSGSGDIETKHLVGDLNGGGPLLHLRTSGGSIRLKAL